MILIGYGIGLAGWHLWLPAPAGQEESALGTGYIFAGCALSLVAAVWSLIRANPVWVTVCAGLPGILVGWATLDDSYDLKRHLAAVVSFPLAISGVAQVIRAGRRRRPGLD